MQTDNYKKIIDQLRDSNTSQVERSKILVDFLRNDIDKTQLAAIGSFGDVTAITKKIFVLHF